MRVALLHDYLNQYGGAERVLEELMAMFPGAPIYTLMHDDERTLNRFNDRVRGTSFLDFPLARRNHRAFIPLMPLAAGAMTLDDNHDLIISDTAGFAKGFRCPRGAKHIAYIHTPLRYAWEPAYINSKFKNQNSKLRNLFFKPVLSYLKWWDYKMAQRPDVLIANSQFIADKIKRYYGREARVIYPPVDTDQFYYNHDYDGDYYLAVGRMLHYKKFDLIVEAFARSQMANRKLLIVGKGPELNKLKVKSEKLKVNVEFLETITDSQLRELYNGAKGLIFPQVEDFGLVAAEAQACGMPVIAYAAGGALEIVKDGETGVFFKKQTPESLAAALGRFEKMSFNRRKISLSAQRFSKDNFNKQLLDIIKTL